MPTVFSDLPVEIREAIYEHTLEDTPEVWIHGSCKDHDGQWPTTPYVLTGFPAIMHICYESRAVALKHVALASLPLESGAQLLVPCRPFRPELDWLYANVPLEALTTRLQPASPTAMFQRLEHMAFPVDALIRNWKSLYRHFRKFPALRDVAIVFGPHYGLSPGWVDDDDSEEETSLGFGGHCGHYRLIQCPEAGLRLRVDSLTSTPAKKTIGGMRRDLDVLTRLLYREEEEAAVLTSNRRHPPTIKTVRMARLGKFFGETDIEAYVQPAADPGRP